MVPVSLDGNFQLKRLDQTSCSFVNDPCAKTVNTLWKANTDIVSPGNKVRIKLLSITRLNGYIKRLTLLIHEAATIICYKC